MPLPPPLCVCPCLESVCQVCVYQLFLCQVGVLCVLCVCQVCVVSVRQVCVLCVRQMCVVSVLCVCQVCVLFVHQLCVLCVLQVIVVCVLCVCHVCVSSVLCVCQVCVSPVSRAPRVPTSAPDTERQTRRGHWEGLLRPGAHWEGCKSNAHKSRKSSLSTAVMCTGNVD